MGGPGSGRRRVKAPEKGFSLTPADGTVDTAKVRLAEISEGVISGAIDARTADTLIAAERATITAGANEEERRLIDKYDELLRRAEAINQEAVAREVADRQHLKH